MEGMDSLSTPMQVTKEHLTAIGEVWTEFAKVQVEMLEDKIPASVKSYLPYFKEKMSTMAAPAAPAETGA